MLSDVCKHCQRAGCLENCPTGAIIRTEFDSVYRAARHLQRLRLLRGGLPVRRDRSRPDRRPRLEVHALLRPPERPMEPACAKACPTDSILFGEVAELREKAAAARGGTARARRQGGVPIWREDAAASPAPEGLNAFFLLVDKPEVYNLPPEPVAPAKRVAASWASMALASLGLLAAAVGAVASARGGRRMT